MAITMKGKYLNRYEAAFDTLSKMQGYTKENWELNARQGTLGQYTDMILRSSEIQDFDKKKERVGWDYTSPENRELMMYTELYADRNEKKKRKDPVYTETGEVAKDINGNEMYNEYEATDYEYMWKQLDQQKSYFAEQYKLKLEEEHRQNIVWWKKVGADLASTAGRFGEGVAQGFAGLVAFMEGAGEFVMSALEGQDIKTTLEDTYDAISQSQAWEFFKVNDIARDLAEFERRYTHYYSASGDNFGTYFGKVANSVANMFGKMVPSMMVGGAVSELASGLTATTSTTTAMGSTMLGTTTYTLPQSTISTISEVASKFTFYAGVTAEDARQSYQTMVLNPESNYSRSTSWLLVNSVVKSAFQWGVEEALASIIGVFEGGGQRRTGVDAMVYGSTSRTQIADSLGKAAGKRILKDMLQEGTEEVLQDVSDAFVNQFMSAALKQDFGGFKDITIGDLIDSFVVAAVGSLIGNAKQITVELVHQIKGDTPVQITYDKDGNMKARKLNAIQAWEYGLDMQSFIQNYTYITEQADLVYRTYGKDSAEAQAYKSAFQEMYAAFKMITSIYSAYGPERAEHTNDVLTQITDYINSDVYTDPAGMAEKMLKTVEVWERRSQRDYNKELIKRLCDNANISDVTNVVDRDNVDQLDLSPETAKEFQEAFAGDEKLQRIYLTNNGDRAVSFEYDDHTRGMFVPKNVAKEGAKIIYRNVAEQRLVETVSTVEGFKPKLQSIKLKYVEITGQDIDTEEVVYQLLYNKEFFKAALWTVGKDVLDIADKIQDVANKAVSKDLRENEYVTTLKETFNNMAAAVVEYCIYNESALIPTWVSKNADLNKQIKMKRYSKDLRNRVVKNGWGSLTKTEQKLLETRVNSMTIAKSQKDTLLANLKSTNENIRETAMNAIARTYEAMFRGPYDGNIYLQWGTKGNNVFNYYLQTHNITLRNFLTEDGLNANEKQYVQSKYGALTDENILQYRQDNFKQATHSTYRFSIENGNLVIYESDNGKMLSFDFYRDADGYKDVVNDKTIVTTKRSSDKYERGVFNSILSDKLDDASRASLGINDVITNPESFLATNIKDAIRNDYGYVDEESTFMYLRRYFVDKLTDTTVLKMADGSYRMGTISSMSDVFLTDKGVPKNSKNLDINQIVKEKYLVGRLAGITVEYTNDKNVAAQYDPNTNTIIINNKLDGKLLNFAFAHEFQHAIQYENQMTAGLNDGWLYNVRKANPKLAKEIVDDIRKHVPNIFVRNGKQVNDATAIYIANDYVYYASGEYQAYGVEGKIDFAPVTIHDTHYGTMLTLPWGKQIKLSDTPMSFTYINSPFDLNLNPKELAQFQDVAVQIDKLFVRLNDAVDDIFMSDIDFNSLVDRVKIIKLKTKLKSAYSNVVNDVNLRKLFALSENTDDKYNSISMLCKLFASNNSAAIIEHIESGYRNFAVITHVLQRDESHTLNVETMTAENFDNAENALESNATYKTISRLIARRVSELTEYGKLSNNIYNKSLRADDYKMQDPDELLKDGDMTLETANAIYKEYNNSPYMRKLAKNVFAKAKQLRSALPKTIAIEMVKDPGPGKKGMLGWFEPWSGQVRYVQPKVKETSLYNAADVILHELTHMCTLYFIDGLNAYNELNDSGVFDIEDWTYVYDNRPRVEQTFVDPETGDVIEAGGYADYEFLFDMFNNKDSNNLTAQIVTDFQSLWQYLLDNYYIGALRPYMFTAQEPLLIMDPQTGRKEFYNNDRVNPLTGEAIENVDELGHRIPTRLATHVYRAHIAVSEMVTGLSWSNDAGTVYHELMDIPVPQEFSTLFDNRYGQHFDTMFDILIYLSNEMVTRMTPEFYNNMRKYTRSTTTLKGDKYIDGAPALEDAKGEFALDGLNNKVHPAPLSSSSEFGDVDTATFDRRNSFAMNKVNKSTSAAIGRFEDAKKELARTITDDSDDEHGILINSTSGYAGYTFKGGKQEIAVKDITDNIDTKKKQDVFLHTHPGRTVAHLSLDDIFANYDSAIEKGLRYVGVVTKNGDIELMDITALTKGQKDKLRKKYKALENSTNYADDAESKLYASKYTKQMMNNAWDNLQHNVFKGLAEIGVHSEDVARNIVNNIYQYVKSIDKDIVYEQFENDITSIIEKEVRTQTVDGKMVGNKYKIAAAYITNETYFNQPEFISKLDEFAKEELAENLKAVGSSYDKVFVDFTDVVKANNGDLQRQRITSIKTTRKENAKKRKELYTMTEIDRKDKKFSPLTGPRYVSRERAKGTNLEYFFKSDKYQRVQMHPALQYFVVNADESLPGELWMRIKNGTLKEQHVLDYFRDFDDIDNKTFKLINDAFFQNSDIKTAKELQKLTLNRAAYWAARIVLRELKYDDAIINAQNMNIYDKVIKIIGKNAALKSKFDYYIDLYDYVSEEAMREAKRSHNDGDSKFEGALHISDKYTKTVFMRHYDGTPFSAGSAANIAREVAKQVRYMGWQITGDQMTRKHVDIDSTAGKEDDAQLSEVIADEHSTDDFVLATLNQSRERKATIIMALIRQQYEKKYKDDANGNRKVNDAVIKLSNELSEFTDQQFEKVYKKYTKDVNPKKLRAMQIVSATLDYIGNEIPNLSTVMLDKLYKRSEKVAEQVRPDRAVRTNVKHLVTTIRKNLSENDRKRFIEDNKDFFTTEVPKQQYVKDQNGDFVLDENGHKVKETVTVPAPGGIAIKDELINGNDATGQKLLDLENTIRELSQRVKRGEYSSKDAMEIKKYYEKLVAKRERDFARQIKNLTKLLTVQVGDQTVEIQTDKAIPKSLLHVLDTEFTFNRESHVKYLDYENRDYAAANYKLFVEANAEYLQQLSQQDVDELVDFLSTSQIIANDNNHRKAMAAQVYLMVYLLRGNKLGNFVLNEEQYNVLNERLANTVSVGQQIGGMWRAVMKDLKPEETMLNALALKAEVEFRPDDVQALVRAATAGDVEQMKVASQRLEQNAKVISNKTKLDALLQFERMAMLSGTGTWVRNIASNVAITGLNKASETIGDKTTNFLSKMFPNAKFLKHRENQYKIVGTKVPTEVATFVKNNVLDNGLLDLIDEGLSKQHIDSDNFGKTSSLIVDAIRQKVRNDVLGANASTNPYLAKIYQFVYERLSDSKFVNKAFVRYLGKTLTEDNVDLSRGLSDEVQEHVSEAYRMAAADYMHKGNFWGEVEKVIHERVGDKGFFVYKQVFPFAQSSFNWFVEGLRYTPAGLAMAIKNLVKLENTIANLDAQRADGKQVVSSKFAEYLARRDIGKGIIGSITCMIGAALILSGAIKLKDDDDKVVIQIGDVSVDMSSIFGSQGLILGISMAHALKEKDAWTALRITLDQMFKDSTINSLANNLRYGLGNYIQNIPFSMANMYFPNFIATFSKIIRTYKPAYHGGLYGRFERFFSDNIPGIAYAMPKYVDPYTGKKQFAYSNPLLTIGVNMINKLTPIDVEAFSYSKYEKEAINLGINKSMPTGNYTINKTNIKLDAKNRAAASEFYGKLNERDLKRLMDTNALYTVEDDKGNRVELPYSRMSKEQKKSVVNRIMTNNGTYAKIYILTETGKCTYYGTQNELDTLRALGIRKNLKLQNGNKKGLVIN